MKKLLVAYLSLHAINDINFVDTFVEDILDFSLIFDIWLMNIQGKYHGTYDFIFVDADKENYINYHKRLIDLVKVGGLIGYDNTLWNGCVVAPLDAPMREYVRYCRDFVLELNKALAVDPRIEICMLSIGDGITLCRRII